jgi:DNA polymerase I-like protein with 3'-5' exonuclease and polymerase domains/uracil-DNA glycosylase
MRDIDLRLEQRALAVDATPEPIAPRCSLCRGKSARRTACIAPVGDAGGLVIVLPEPSRQDDQVGRLGTSPEARLILAEATANWSGPVLLDTALRCVGMSSADDLMDNATNCRPYSAATARNAKRVILCGKAAMAVWLGRKPDTWSIARGSGWLDDTTPFFVIPDLGQSEGNRLKRKFTVEALRWACTAPDPPRVGHHAASLVETTDDALRAVELLESSARVTFDAETCGRLWWPNFTVLTIAAVAYWPDTDVHQTFVWDIAFTERAAWAALCRLLGNKRVPKCAHNAKFDLSAVLHGLKQRVRGFDVDTMLWAGLLAADISVALEPLAERVGMGGHKAEAHAAEVQALSRLRQTAKLDAPAARSQRTLIAPTWTPTPLQVTIAREWDAGMYAVDKQALFCFMDPEIRMRYCARDALATSLLAEHLAPQIAANPGFTAVWRDVLKPVVEMVVDLERVGVPMSRDAIEAHGSYLAMRNTEVVAKMRAWVPEGFNPSSPDQVAKLLFDTFQIPPPKRTGRSTAAAAIEPLADKHPFIPVLLEWRDVDRNRTHYANGRDGKSGMLAHIAPDGRVHADVFIDGAESGRFSIKKPALQTIPRPETFEAALARNQLQALPGWTLVEYDYSQLEIRCMAMLSQDPDMMAICNSGQDFHRAAAALVYTKAFEDVTDTERSAVKSVVFGIAYGMGADGLARKLGVTVARATDIMAAVLGKFTRLRALIDDTVREVRTTGMAWGTWNGARGRVRPMWDIADPEEWRRGHAERAAFNMLVQNTGSEYALRSNAAVHQWAMVDDNLPVEPILPVHDSLLLHVRNDYVGEVHATVPRIMTQWPSFGVKLVVDAKEGTQWGSLAKIKL